MERKKIDILIPDFSDLGAQRVAINLANGLKDIHDIRFVVFERNGPFEKYLDKNVPVFSLNEWTYDIPKLRVLFRLFSYRKFVKKHKTEIAISFSPITNYAVLVGKFFNKKLKTIIQEHAFPSLFLKDRENVSSLYEFLFKYLFVRLYELSDCFVTITEAIKEDFIKNFKIRSTYFKVVRNPLDISRIEQMKDENVNDFMFKQDIKYLIGVGRLSEQKNFKRLIDVFEKVENALEKVELIIIGKGSLESELKTYAKEKGIIDKIHFLGFKNNPYTYIAKSDVFCLSSNWEGLPQVLAEAMICKTLIVAHDCQSGPKEMIENEKTGILVKYGDIEEFSKKIIEVLSNEKITSSIKENAYIFASHEYSLEKYVSNYKEIINILGNKIK